MFPHLVDSPIFSVTRLKNPSIKIRIADNHDAGGILACLAAAFEPYRTSYTPEAFLDTVLTPATIARRFSEMAVFVAIGDVDGVLGTIACSPVDSGEGHLRGMAVLPSLQGTGVAAQLLGRAESYFQEKNCTRISLDTTAPLQRAIRFYERAGYRPSGRVQDFFGMPLFEYVKPLSSSRPHG
jgi:GNAT superfamily N-acetyltransferase